MPEPEPLRSLAYVNHGRWVADCAVCPSALLVKPEVGAVFDDGTRWDPAAPFVCRDRLCGATSVIVWPADLRAIELLLAERSPQHRNWHPWETPADLLAENIEHGVTPVKGL